MPVAYPLNLRTIISTSKSRTQPAAFALSQPRRGYGFIEPTGTDTPLFWDVLFRFTRAEAERFRLWFVYGLRRGTLTFSMPVQTEFGLQTYTLQFLPDSLLPLRHNGEVFEYSAQVMARAEVVPSATLTADSGVFSGTIPDQTMYAGASFSLALSGYFTGGTAPFTFGVGGGTLPVALAVNGSTGVVSGIPSIPGVYAGVVFERRGSLGVPAQSNAVRFTVLDPNAAAAGTTRPITVQLVSGNVAGSSSAIASGKTFGISSAILGGAASAPAAGDPLFADVILLLPFDLESGYSYGQLQPMRDYSPFNHSPGTTGYMKPLAGDGAFGGSRLTSFNNGGDNVEFQTWPKNPATENARFGRSITNGLSIEAFVYGPPFSFELGLGDNSDSAMALIGSGTGISLSDAQAQEILIGPGSLGGAVGWHHVAATCTADGLTQELFYKGASYGTITATYTQVSSVSNFVQFTGQIDSVRVTKNRRYSSGFAPPTADFPRA